MNRHDTDSADPPTVLSGQPNGFLYLDDRFTSRTIEVEKERIISFASEFDPQPFHLSEDLAGGTFFRGLAASGRHTAALTMRLLVDGGLPIAGGLVGASVEIQWPLQPVPVTNSGLTAKSSTSPLRSLTRTAARSWRAVKPAISGTRLSK
jgi:acyl dehydratase